MQVTLQDLLDIALLAYENDFWTCKVYVRVSAPCAWFHALTRTHCSSSNNSHALALSNQHRRRDVKVLPYVGYVGDAGYCNLEI